MEVLCILVLVVSAVGAQLCADEGVTATFEIGVGGRLPPGNIAEIEVNSGGPLSLSCIYTFLIDSTGTSLNVQSYEWYHNGIRLNTTSADLQIQSFRGLDGGVYECRIITAICSTPRSSQFIVNVSPDLWIVEPRSLAVEVTEGQPFTLNCQAAGWPTPSVQWLMSGSVVSEERVYTVDSALLSHTGNYTCRAYNEIGSTNESISVLIIALPPTLPPTTTDIMTTQEETTMQIQQTTTMDFEEIQIQNVTSDQFGFYIAVGVTGGVSLILGVISFCCCVIALYASCCYKRKKEEHDQYVENGWCDEGGEEGAGEKNNKPMEFTTLNVNEIADPMGGGDSVVVVYQETEDADDMNSPSEIGERV